MPSFYTHYIFLKNIDKDASNVKLIGSFGPDPFMYFPYFLLPMKGKDKLKRLGNYLHEIDTSLTFNYCYDYIQKETDEYKKKVLMDYLEGIISHYALDSICHPFIFYWSGFENDANPNYKYYFLSHTMMETCLDVLIKHEFGYDNLTPRKVTKHHKKDLKIVNEMWYSYLHDHLKIDFYKKNYFRKVIKRMRLAQTLLRSKHGIKRKFFKKFFYNSPVFTMSAPTLDKLPPLDFLNLNHETYTSLTDNTIKYNYSFLELMDLAKEKYEKMLTLLGKPEEMKAFVDQIDHDGVKIGKRKIYFEMIWDRLPQEEGK